MPITEELKNVKKFESVGFSHEQSEALAESLEYAQVNGNERLKEFISAEIKELRAEIKELRAEINTSELRLKADIATTSKDLLVKIFGIVVGTVGMAVTIIKLFP